jgi:polyhydroxybutyrate depolymerase
MRTVRRATIAAAASALALTALLTGCVRPVATGSPAQPLGAAAGSTTQTITVDGLTRSFHLYRPASTTAGTAGRAVPLVVMLHGGFGSGTQAESAYGWDGEADREGFVVAYPDGIDRAWNAGGGCCGKPATSGVDDVAFLTAMVTTIEGELPVDRARVYATGISNGGLMAYRLACDTRVFAAIGPDSATMLGPCPSPARVSVIHIHGTADHNIPYDGGTGDGVAEIDGPAVPALLASWRGIDGCGQPQVSVAGLVTTSLAPCPDGRAVELVTIAGAGHQWPGGASKPVLQRVLHLDPPSTALDATGTIWQFFAAHPMPADARAA